ncbi:hypothetical protein M5K25_013318 [Dendrobium thyrsiflorum]|uniref:Uncharacterized protein n=1 Tax=Dendrobium thyrsiflorum TaxID=117978 RepID=A0ABD0USK2_DENTH
MKKNPKERCTNSSEYKRRDPQGLSFVHEIGHQSIHDNAGHRQPTVGLFVPAGEQWPGLARAWARVAGRLAAARGIRLNKSTKDVGPFRGCMSKPCSMTLTCEEEVERIHQRRRTLPRLYVRALLDDVNLCGRGRENPPRMSKESTKDVGPFLGCMSEPCSMTLTCVEEVERIHQRCRTFPRLYVRALLDDVNLCGRGRKNPPRIGMARK